MKITGNRGPHKPLGAQQAIQTANPAARDVAPTPSAFDKDLYIPSQDWLRLVELFSQQPEIRQERVVEVGEKLQRGLYLTPESDEQTAAAMLLAAA